jgi:uncharacterized protein (DUF4415 family)
MKEAASDGLTSRQRGELARLASLAEDRIDTADIPEVRDWSGARRGVFYRPVKQQLTLRIDADVVAWFKSRAPKGEGYQTDMNQALRDHVRRFGRLRRAGGHGPSRSRRLTRSPPACILPP